MTLEQALQKDIEDSERWLNLEKEESTYKRDLAKRIELINWVLEKIRNPDFPICNVIETKMNLFVNEINEMGDAKKADALLSELRILEWILDIVCSNE